MHSKKFKTWTEITELTCGISHKIKTNSWSPDIIIGITRGGLTPAVILSNTLDTPMKTWEISLRDSGKIADCPLSESELREKNILIIDDLNDTGQTFITIENIIKKTSNIKFAALINNKSSLFKDLDYFSEEIDKSIDPAWIVFPWEKQGQ